MTINMVLDEIDKKTIALLDLSQKVSYFLDNKLSAL